MVLWQGCGRRRPHAHALLCPQDTQLLSGVARPLPVRTSGPLSCLPLEHNAGGASGAGALVLPRYGGVPNAELWPAGLCAQVP